MKWAKVYSTKEIYQAEIVKATLEERGVNAVIVDKVDSAYNDFGQREVYVEEKYLDRAILIIKQDVEFK
ncbi:DUF2007 domain-containing protein [Limibacter armeniacum]|uniref:putative signal transducing protein n=1 Tax=Limibacter armeniacum TaxID=466084 RepID=UPI002FE5AC99